MPDLRPEAAEAVGTFFLLLAGGAALLTGQPGWLVALAFGGVVAVMVCALGHVSGAHFNPAVTLALAATGHFPWHRVLPYVAAQAIGALAAALLLRGLGGLAPAVAAGRLDGLPAFAVEALATALLAFTIVAVATDPRVPRGVAGFAIGLAVALGALVAGPLTGAAMNPARALAPAVLAGHTHGLAVHVLGPFAGALAGMAGYEALRPGRAPRTAAA
jgi:MIP family channel proteins